MKAIPEIILICVGAIKDRHIAALIQQYVKRLRYETRMEIREIGDDRRSLAGERILEIMGRIKGYVFTLSEEGRLLTSPGLASLIQTINRKIVFVIGGPDGLDERVKKKADYILSLSSLTFTHEIARLLLIEQIYRASTIMHGGNYHK